MTHPEPEPDPATEDELWRQIVDNYGERPAVPETPETPAAGHPEPEHAYAYEELAEDEEPDEPDDPDDHYRPPEPPPVQLPRGPRAAAWIAMLGGPALILVLLMLKLIIPSWLGWFVFLGFVGGFGYLVSTMNHEGGGEGWDDGSRI